ncbi:musculin [Thamnophis elegans]|uniref:musculin n=1 Tax=Thamnophis elegans TaxID=35005 RepID=UPI0013774007|nr:musculin [Thamnophis elegans]
MLTGSEELPERRMDLRELQLEYRAPPRSKRRPRGETCPSLDNSEEEEEEEEEEDDEEDDEEDEEDEEAVASKKKRTKGGSGAREGGGIKKQPAAGRSASGSTPECKQSQRNAANARERARMRVLSKAFSRLKTSLPWVPPDTKLSKLDTLRLASSYIAHLRQLLQEDCYEKGYVHPVNLTWPFVVSGRPESDTKDVPTASRLCGTTA